MTAQDIDDLATRLKTIAVAKRLGSRQGYEADVQLQMATDLLATFTARAHIDYQFEHEVKEVRDHAGHVSGYLHRPHPTRTYTIRR